MTRKKEWFWVQKAVDGLDRLQIVLSTWCQDPQSLLSTSREFLGHTTEWINSFMVVTSELKSTNGVHERMNVL